MESKSIFKDFIGELKKDLKRRGNFWSPVLISSEQEARTVILRGLQPGKFEINDFIIHTDTRSQKWFELQGNPTASLLFYCKKRKWQMRVKTKVKTNTQDFDSKIEWDRLTTSSQKIYSLKNSPGTPTTHPDVGFTFSDTSGYKNFGVLTLAPLSLESLQLSHPTREDQHVRAHWDLISNEVSFLVP